MQISPDNYVGKLFTYYDQAIASFPLAYQGLISLALLIFLLANLYVFIKKGHWILILVLIAALPATWPATKKVFEILILIFKGIFYRIQH